MSVRKIYVASSWRNPHQQEIVAGLKDVGFEVYDFRNPAPGNNGFDWCDTCVMVLPCGRSAHLEAGYACGQGKTVIFYLRPEKFEPELMYLLGSGFASSLPQLISRLST